LTHFDSETLDSVFGFPQSGRIHETQRPLAAVDHSLERIPSSAWDLGHDRARPTKKCVEERRFAGVRWACDHYDRAFADDFTRRSGGNERFKIRGNFFRGFIDLIPGDRPIVLFGEIDIVGNQRFEPDKVISQLQ